MPLKQFRLISAAFNSCSEILRVLEKEKCIFVTNSHISAWLESLIFLGRVGKGWYFVLLA